MNRILTTILKTLIILLGNNSSGFGNIDFDTIMKMKSIIDKMNIKDDPRSNLLESLKPYLKESRKSKIDQYIQLMNISRVMDVFPFDANRIPEEKKSEEELIAEQKK